MCDTGRSQSMRVLGECLFPPPILTKGGNSFANNNNGNSFDNLAGETRRKSTGQAHPRSLEVTLLATGVPGSSLDPMWGALCRGSCVSPVSLPLTTRKVYLNRKGAKAQYGLGPKSQPLLGIKLITKLTPGCFVNRVRTGAEKVKLFITLSILN